ncbi:hypothetical protein D3C81_1313300 [compost metagenome]
MGELVTRIPFAILLARVVNPIHSRTHGTVADGVYVQLEPFPVEGCEILVDLRLGEHQFGVATRVASRLQEHRRAAFQHAVEEELGRVHAHPVALVGVAQVLQFAKLRVQRLVREHLGGGTHAQGQVTTLMGGLVVLHVIAVDHGIQNSSDAPTVELLAVVLHGLQVFLVCVPGGDTIHCPDRILQ